VRLFPAQVDGDVAWATVEAPPRVLAAVFDDSGIVPIGGRLVGIRALGGLIDAIRADRAADVNAIELVAAALPYVAAQVPVAGSWWRASFWGIWEPCRSAMVVSGASINLGGDEWSNVVQLTQLASGAEVRTRLRRDAPLRVVDRSELAAALDGIATEVRAALDARAAWRARPFSDVLVGHRLVEALGADRWTLHAHEDFPFTRSVHVSEREAAGEHTETVRERDGIVEVCGRKLSSVAELAAALPELVAAIRVNATRLRPAYLRAGVRYRVLRAFKGVALGERVTFADAEHSPRDGGTRWFFEGGVELYSEDPGDSEILGALHEYLALDSQS
jgi:hypothetical protein